MTRSPFDSGKGMPEQNDTPEPGLPFGPDAAAHDDTAGDNPDDTAAQPGGLDELALRRLLHDAVRDVEPRGNSLDQLSRAIPARRARRRQVMIGAAAGVLLVGTAVPAVLHLSDLGYGSAGSAAGSDAQASGSAPATLGSELPSDRFGYPVPGTAGGHGVSPRASTPGLGADASPTNGDPTNAPPCSRDQLGQGSARTDAPDAQGRVHGTFRVVNVSGTSCAVVGAGQIAVATQGSAGGIQVVDHTQGDPATALLPNPSDDPAAVVLPPGEAYQVQFAWIPASGGSTGGCPTDPPPSAGSGGTDDSGGGSGSGDSSDAGTTAGSDSTGGTSNSANSLAATSTTDDGGVSAAPPQPSSGPGDGAVALSTIPPEGGPVAATTDISGVCSGTVYQTDPLPTG